MGGRGGLPRGRGCVPLARAARGDGQGANRGRSRAVWVGVRRVGDQVAPVAYGAAGRRGAGKERREMMSVAVLLFSRNLKISSINLNFLLLLGSK